MKKAMWSMSLVITLLSALSAGCYYIFHQLVDREMWELPDFIARMINGNSEGEETDHYLEEVDRQVQWLKQQPMEKWELENSAGMTLRGRLWKPEKPSNLILLGVHGCRSSGLGEFAFSARYYHKKGYNVLFIDHRACGESEGEYMGYGYYESRDTMLWIDRLIQTFGSECRIFLHGVSMGSATVLMMSGMGLPKNVKGIIADCGYTTAWNEFAYQIKSSFHVPPFPVLPMTNLFCKWKAGYSFKEANPIEQVKKAKVPILFIHGEKDDYVPTYMVYELYDACASKKDLLVVEDAVHARSYYTHPDVYEAKVNAFITQCLHEEECPC